MVFKWADEADANLLAALVESTNNRPDDYSPFAVALGLGISSTMVQYLHFVVFRPDKCRVKLRKLMEEVKPRRETIARP